MGSKIRLNCIAPSLVETKMTERLTNSDLKKESITNKHPSKNWETSDISNMISFFYFLTSQNGLLVNLEN